MPKTKTPPRKRYNVPVCWTMPPDELARVKHAAQRASRPFSWIMRDAVRLYLDALDQNAEALARIRINPDGLGKTQPSRIGKPPRANVRKVAL